MILSEKLKFAVCLALAISVAPVVSPAADEADSIRTGLTRENGLHPGMWALMFQIDEDLVPQAFDGMTFSAKRQRSRNSALRLGLSLGLSMNSTEGESQYFWDDTLRTDRDDMRESDGFDIGLELLYIRYPWPDSYINAFWGLGPLVNYSRYKAENTRTEDEGDGVYESFQYLFEESFAAGLKGIIGVEWFATKRISFHAEYQCVFRYRYIRRDTEEERPSYGARNTGESTSDYIEFYGRGALFGISLYF